MRFTQLVLRPPQLRGGVELLDAEWLEVKRGVRGAGFAEERGRQLGLERERTGEPDEVRCAGGDRLAHPGPGAEAACDHQRDRRDLADGLGELQEVRLAAPGALGGAAGHGGGLVGAAGDLEHVDVLGVELCDDIQGLLLGETAALEVGQVQLDREDLVGPDRDADRARDLEQEPPPTLGVAAPFVVALIGRRREELGDEVAVGTVQLDAVEARFDDDPGGLGEPRDQLEDLLPGERPRLRGSGMVAGDRARCDHAGGQADKRLSPGVVDLDDCRRASRLGGGRPPAERREVPFVFDHDVARLPDRPAVDHDVAGDQHPGAAAGPPRVEALERLRRRAGDAGELLAHRRLHEPVLDGGAAPKGERRVEDAGGVAGRDAHDASRNSITAGTNCWWHWKIPPWPESG